MSNETKQTPGPWGFGPSGPVMIGYSLSYGIFEEGPGNLIAGIFNDGRGGEEAAEANARLIAAAPDLLEACRLAEQYRGMVGSPTWLKLRDAIAKATGVGA
jgi:hypothetical protein